MLLPVLFVCSLIGTVIQDPAPNTAAKDAREVSRLLRRLAAAAEKADEDEQAAAALEKAERALNELVAPYVEGAPHLTEEHYVEVTSALLDGRALDLILRSTEAGIERFKESRRLLDHLGMAYLLMAQDATSYWELRGALHQAVGAFARARPLEPKSMHTEFGAWQAHLHLGEHAEALVAFDLLRADEVGQAYLQAIDFHRGKHLLGCGRAEEAIAEFATALKGETSDPDAVRLLMARAQFLAKQTEAAMQTTQALLEATDDSQIVGGVADLWFEMGKKREALALLKKRPVEAGEEEEGENYKEARSRAALELLLAPELKNHAAFRAAYAEALGHRFAIMAPGADGKMAQQDLSGSPACMGFLLRKVKMSPATWAENGLFALCLSDLSDHKLTPSEAMVLGTDADMKAALNDPATLTEVLQMLRTSVAEERCEGAFALRRLMEHLEAPKKRTGSK